MIRRNLLAGFIFSIFILPARGRTFAQTSASVDLFNAYYKESIEELRQLYNVRQAVFSCDPVNNPFESIKKFLSVYKSNKVKTGVIFYSFDSLELRTWLIRDDQLFYHRQPASFALLKDTEVNLRNALQVDVLHAADSMQRGIILKGSNSKKEDLNVAIDKASKLLLPAPIAENLPGLKHIIFITEFNIGQIPLYLLKPYGNDAYLIDSVSIALAPHLCNLGNIAGMNRLYMGKPNKLFAQDALIVGDPAYATDPERQLPRLPGAAEEAKRVSKWTQGTLLLDSAATISKVKALARQSDLLYFATHGYSDVEKVLDGSFLAFAPDSTNPTGLWTARQIQQENFMKTQMMAILSACQTGVGKVYDAGFIGLGRAFFKAGVDHTIMSLWSVSDKGTMELMRKFLMKLLTKEMDFYPASHLREAILDYKKTEPNPALWAPFVLFGFAY